MSATLSLLDGLAKGLFGRPDASCDGLRTNGDCLSGDSMGDDGFDGVAKAFVGDALGVAPRTVDGVLVTGDSGRLNGEGRGENDIVVGRFVMLC